MIKWIHILAFTAVLFACKKDKVMPQDFIIPVEPQAVIITSVNDTLFGQYNGPPDEYLIDFDKDGTDDIKLVSYVWGSPAIGMQGNSNVSCMNEGAEIIGYFRTDTNFMHESFGYYPNGTQVYGVTSQTYTCYPMDPSDSILQIEPNVFKIIPKSGSDKISMSESSYSVSSGMDLSHSSYSFPPTVTGGSGDTTYILIQNYLNDCNSFPQNESTYIGIKIKGEKYNRLGWVKVKLISSAELVVENYAIQQEF